MKKMVVALAVALFVSSAQAKQVSVCITDLIGAEIEMECTGDFSGSGTILGLYKAGWSFVGNVSGTNRFVLIFEK